MIIGLDVYLFYGLYHSHFREKNVSASDYRICAISGVIMSIMLIILAYLHHSNVPDDYVLLLFSLALGVSHLFIFMWFYFRKPAIKSDM
jgi:APA family basic amino acid/polyamine antiporter